VFVGSDKIRIPDRCVFADEEDVKRYQAGVKFSSIEMGDATIVLQADAMEALLKAQVMARAKRLKITPLDGAVAGGRDYGETLRLWHSRFDPAIRFWLGNGMIKRSDALSVMKMDIFGVIEQVHDWESQGMLFGTGQRSSIFSSVAPPGTSQHLSGLAFDVVEHDDPRVRTILEKNGWFNTIKADTPHFTYLGLSRKELPSRGLQEIEYNGRTFWVPAREPRVSGR